MIFHIFWFFSVLSAVNSHVYLAKPVSRNFWKTGAFQDSPDEYCEHCYQSGGPSRVRARGGDQPWPHLESFNEGNLAPNGNYLEDDDTSLRHGIAGDPGQTAPEDSNKYGLSNNNYPVIDAYTSGATIEMKIIVSTWHYGHLEIFVCKSDEEATVSQSCFNEYPLSRVEAKQEPPIDPSHEGRYFLDPPCRESETDQTGIPPGSQGGQVVTATYKLPDGLVCDRCVLQMVYYTGNSCSHPGYGEFNPDSWPSGCAETKDAWVNTGLSLCGEGSAYPEEFHNVADIRITDDDATDIVPEPSATPVNTYPGDSNSNCSGQWEQCGGIDWDGRAACCEHECVKRNDWYFQCV